MDLGYIKESIIELAKDFPIPETQYNTISICDENEESLGEVTPKNPRKMNQSIEKIDSQSSNTSTKTPKWIKFQK